MQSTCDLAHQLKQLVTIRNEINCLKHWIITHRKSHFRRTDYRQRYLKFGLCITPQHCPVTTMSPIALAKYCN